MSGNNDKQTVIKKLKEQLINAPNEQLKNLIRIKLKSLEHNEIIRK